MPRVRFDINNRDHQIIGAVVIKMLDDNKRISEIIEEINDIAGQVWHGYQNEKMEANEQ